MMKCPLRVSSLGSGEADAAPLLSGQESDSHGLPMIRKPFLQDELERAGERHAFTTYEVGYLILYLAPNATP
jgi:hypothetical protein